MIEIKEEKTTDYTSGVLLIDGKRIERVHLNEIKYSAWLYFKELNIYDESLSVEILKYSAKDLKESGINKCSFRLRNLNLFNGIPVRYENFSKRNDVKVIWKEGKSTSAFCYFNFDFDYQNWIKPYSYQTYKQYLNKEIRQLIKSESTNIYLSSTTVSSNDYLRFTLGKEISLKKQIFNFSKILNEANRKAFEKLESEYQTNSLREFNFPLEVRTSCEQYLMYFADFLKEIGVSAVTNIQHSKAGTTLFSVEPENPKIALDAVREALEIYLELPMSPLAEEAEISDSKMLALRAEINTLKVRLDLAQIRQLETEKRSELQKELIETQKELIQEKGNKLNNVQALQKYELQDFKPSIIRDSIVETDVIEGEIVDEPKNNEEVSNKEIDMGLISMKPAKVGGGIEVNTPRLARLGIKKGKELFDYLDKRLNSEEEK